VILQTTNVVTWRSKLFILSFLNRPHRDSTFIGAIDPIEFLPCLVVRLPLQPALSRTRFQVSEASENEEDEDEDGGKKRGRVQPILKKPLSQQNAQFQRPRRSSTMINMFLFSIQRTKRRLLPTTSKNFVQVPLDGEGVPEERLAEQDSH
jgi:hypothetical protein